MKKKDFLSFLIGWFIGTIIALLLINSSKCQAQTQQQVLRELHRQQVPCTKIVLAQARLESGNFKSDFYRKTNNLFGLKKGKKYATYKHWKDSIKDYKERISSRYKSGDYYEFLKEIKYATNPHYVKLIKQIAK